MLFAVIIASLPVFDFATNAVMQRIAGAEPAACLSRFVDYPPSGKWRANEKFWLKGIDFTCVSPWNDNCGAARAGTLISKRHIIFAKHFPLWKGVRILFVDQQGEVCPCTIEATKTLESCDVGIGLLDYEVTPNIHPAKILPENFPEYIGDGKGLPIVTFNQREQAHLSEAGHILTNSIWNLYSKNEKWKKLRGRMVGGDSGNPAFLLIGNEAILLYCLCTGDWGHGPSVLRRRYEVQKAMDELCPGYKLESFDFSTVGK